MPTRSRDPEERPGGSGAAGGPPAPPLRTSLVETRNRIVIHAEGRGVRRGGVDVSVHKRKLTIRTYDIPPEEESGSVRFAPEPVERSVRLPSAVDENRFRTEIKGGRVTVTLRKATRDRAPSPPIRYLDPEDPRPGRQKSGPIYMARHPGSIQPVKRPPPPLPRA